MTFSQLGIGFFGARRLLKRDRAAGRDRLRRLSHAAADHRREQLEDPDRDPRAERGDGPRQSPVVARRRPHRALFQADQAARPEAEAKARVTGTPVRDAVLAYREVPYLPPEPVSACCFSCSAAARARASSPRPCRRRLRCLPAEMRQRLTVVQQAPRGGSRSTARDLQAGRHRRASRAVLPRPAGADRQGASGRRPRRRLDRCRIDGDRPALPAGAAAARPRQRSARKCNAPATRRAAAGACASKSSPATASPVKSNDYCRSPEVLAGAAAKAKAMAETQAVQKLADLAEELARAKR